MNKNEANKLINEEMMRTSDEEIKDMCHTFWCMYSGFISEGFTKRQAMELIKMAIRPKI